MGFNLHNRHLLSLFNHSAREINFLLDLSRDLKRAKYAGTEQQRLKGKNIALIFEKTSTRTRCAFEVAAYDQGANVTYIDPTSSQIGHKESMKDTARVLGRMYDGIEYRGFSQKVVKELADYAGVPVFNGLTDEFHPTQPIWVMPVTIWLTHCCWWGQNWAWMCVWRHRKTCCRMLILLNSVRCSPRRAVPALW